MDVLRILIVDDEPGMRMAVMRALRDFKVSLPDVEGEVTFTVDQAGDGEEALQKINDFQPHIILLDYKLPDISGLEILEKLRGKPNDILTVMITAYASLETAVTATKLGAYDFLAKPFTPDELKSVIRKTSGRHILLQQARKLAEERRKVRFQFISVLAHELKSPIASIDGYLQIMKGHIQGEKIEDYDKITERCLIRIEGMRKLIADLLDMTRIESGEKKRELAEIDIVLSAQTAIENASIEAQRRGITINFDSEKSIMVTGDRGEIDIIFNNLVSNAVKYNRDGGKVNVVIRPENEIINISVSDTGIGMSKEEAAKLFNDFVRIKNDKTRNILGSGLGLSILKKIVSLYKGSVSVTSEPDVGSTFTVVINKNN